LAKRKKAAEEEDFKTVEEETNIKTAAEEDLRTEGSITIIIDFNVLFFDLF
jgi:hypothetical protein